MHANDAIMALGNKSTFFATNNINIEKLIAMTELIVPWHRTVFFGVYKCWGPGAGAVRGVSWARELDFESAHPFLVKSFVNGRHWIAPSDA